MVDPTLIGLGAGVGIGLICVCALGYWLFKKRKSSLEAREAAQNLQMIASKNPNDIEGGKEGQQSAQLSSNGAGRNQKSSAEKGSSYSDVQSVSRKDSEGHGLSGSSGGVPSSGVGLKVHTHEQVHSSSQNRRDDGGIGDTQPASPRTKKFKARKQPESPITKGTRKPSKVHTAASGDMGSVVRGLDTSREQPETPPSQKGRTQESRSSPPIAGQYRPEHSPPAFSGPASYGASPQPHQPRPAEPTRTESRRDRTAHKASKSPRGARSPRAATASSTDFVPPPPAPDSSFRRAKTDTLPHRQDRQRTAYSQASPIRQGPTAPDIKPMAGLPTASSIKKQDKQSVLLRYTIKELKQVRDPEAQALAELLGDEFPNKMIVGEAMRQLDERKKAGSTGGMYPAATATPAPGSLMPAVSEAEKQRAYAAVGGLERDLAGYHSRPAQTSPAYGRAGMSPAPSGGGYGGRRPVPREREPPKFKPRTSLGDRPAPSGRYPKKLAEPMPEPFKAPSRITQEYIDGYDSDESMYAPQFAKRSVRRLSVDETGVSQRDMRRAFEAVAAGDGVMRSKRRLHGAGPRTIGLDKSGELTEKEFYEKYWIEAGKLGEGSFARVRKITRKVDRAPFALKVIKKAGKSREDLAALEQEIKLLSRINHKNVVNLTDWVYTKKRIYMVVEFCSGGDVFERILAEKTFSEANAAGVIRQVLEGLDHIHTRHIVHRDLKPDNLMYATKAADAEVKIIDFGLAGDCSKKALTTPCGTAHYAAPEVLSGKAYKTQADMWSLGVIVYMLLCGFPPFFDATGNTKRLYKLIKSGRYRFPSPYWDNISDSAKDFIRGLLEKNVDARMTAAESLSHPWIGGKAEVTSMSDMYLEQMQQFASSRKMLTAGAQLHGPREGEVRAAASPGGAAIFARDEYAFELTEDAETY